MPTAKENTIPTPSMPVAPTAPVVSGDQAAAATTGNQRSGGPKKPKRSVPTGSAYVLATYNNTIVTFTDPNGNVLSQCSAGRAGFRGPKKSTPYAAGLIVRQAAAKTQPYGLREVNVFVRGFGSGREAAIRAINACGIAILAIKDVTPLPHNGCRPKKPRRI